MEWILGTKKPSTGETALAWLGIDTIVKSQFTGEYWQTISQPARLVHASDVLAWYPEGAAIWEARECYQMDGVGPGVPLGYTGNALARAISAVRYRLTQTKLGSEASEALQEAEKACAFALRAIAPPFADDAIRFIPQGRKGFP